MFDALAKECVLAMKMGGISTRVGSLSTTCGFQNCSFVESAVAGCCRSRRYRLRFLALSPASHQLPR